MRKRLIAVAVIGLALAGGVARAQAPGDLPAAELDRVRDAAAALTADLKARLMKEMAAGGPVAAVQVCSEVAQAMAAAHSKDGLVVRRVSDRWRNPADAPDAWESAQLARLAASHAQGSLPPERFAVVGEGASRALRYLKPIVIGGPCLSCHGDPAAIKPEVAVAIRERYPEDRATGYHEGDLRGAVSVIESLAAR
jgi:hypothetical protein